MFGLVRGLKKTKDRIFSPIENLFRAHGVDEDLLNELEELLILSDLGVETSEKIVDALREASRKKELSFDESIKIIAEELREIFDEIPEYIPADGTPRTIVFVGVNGVGKTSTIGKLAYHFGKKGMRVILGCCDTFRAAAKEQLELWARRVGVQVVKQSMGADPAAVAFDTLQAAKARDMDLVLIDTAGRLHTKSNLMEELKKIVRVLSNNADGAPVEVWLVLDANTGQNSLRQAEEFTKAIPVSGIVLTKLDSTAKGGALVPVQKKLKLPVLYVGVGEGIEDIEPFNREQFIEALLGRGD